MRSGRLSPLRRAERSPGLTLLRRRRASRSPLRWSALPLSSGAGGTSQGPERTFRRTCMSKPPLPRVLGAGRRRLSRASRSLLEAATTALGLLRPWTRSTTRALSCSCQRYRASYTAYSSSCSETRSVGQARTRRRRRPSQWTTMTRVAALLRATSRRRFTRLAPGSVTFVSRSTGQPWKTFDSNGRVCPGHCGSSRGSPPIDPATIPVEPDAAARRDKRPIRSRMSAVNPRVPRATERSRPLTGSPRSLVEVAGPARATAVSEALARSSWTCFYTHTCGEWNLSFRNKCWKCSSKNGPSCRSGPRSS